ncbi:C-terminal helicase domain-containing protein, partial [Candidatus Microgenomates bacterium]|nr:C-terminal helicase domain-containing protein [Candidatus Microgenomates bacterium]
FGRTKHGIEKVANELSRRRIKVASIHGNKNQNQRQRALNDFKQGYVKALLATDVASRGIDVENVTHVINFDEPESYEDYVHRIGRTGRAGRGGVALTFIS